MPLPETFGVKNQACTNPTIQSFSPPASAIVGSVRRFLFTLDGQPMGLADIYLKGLSHQNFEAIHRIGDELRV